MSVSLFIRRRINSLPLDKLFSTRDMLCYGFRSAVDQALSRMVKSGFIIRVARGLFIRAGSKPPKVAEVAAAKAAAFGKKIVQHGEEAMFILKINDKPPKKIIYACSGSSSSFCFGDKVIRFVKTNARKMSLGDEQAGLALRAFWHLGKAGCSRDIISTAMIFFNREQRQSFRQSVGLMPVWLHRYFIPWARQ